MGLNFNENYSVTVDGILKVDESSLNDGVETYDYVKILAINGERISTAEDEDLTVVRNKTTANQEFFTTLAAAQVYLTK